MYENASLKGVENWRKLGPLTVEEIIEKSNLGMDLDDEDLEFKRVDGPNACAIGLFRSGTCEQHGIGRVIFDSGQFYECM